MTAAVVHWVPWVLLAAALGLFLFVPDATGVALALSWGSIRRRTPDVAIAAA